MYIKVVDQNHKTTFGHVSGFYHDSRCYTLQNSNVWTADWRPLLKHLLYSPEWACDHFNTPEATTTKIKKLAEEKQAQNCH